MKHKTKPYSAKGNAFQKKGGAVLCGAGRELVGGRCNGGGSLRSYGTIRAFSFTCGRTKSRSCISDVVQLRQKHGWTPTPRKILRNLRIRS